MNFRNFVGLCLTLAISLSTYAAQTRKVGASDYRGSDHAVSAALGIYSPGPALYTGKVNGNDASRAPSVSGLFGIGGDYEYIVAQDMTIGGFFRYYSTSDSIASSPSQEEKLSAWTLSGMVKAYLPTDHWLPYLGAGLGLLSVNMKVTSNNQTSDYDPSTTIGLPMVIGMLYKIDDRMAFGVENMRIWALGEKVNGQPINDFMFKGRFVF